MRFPFELKAANEFDAVGFGTNAVDYLISVPEYPAFNSKVELSAWSISPGGEAASTMVGLQRLGLTCSYVGHFGDDQAGVLVLQSLTDEGVDVTCADTVSQAQTQVAFILIDEKSGERTVIWQRDKKLAYNSDNAPVEIAKRGRILHLTPHDVKACIRMAQTARENGVIVTLDIDNIFDGIDDLIPLADVCITSADFPNRLFGILDTRVGLTEITNRFGCAVAGITLGESGSIFLSGGSFIETTAFAVPGGCVDTTGAGDAFRAGFLYGMLTGEPIDESARIANAVASLKCRGLGARAALPDLAEMKTMLKKV